MSHTGVYPAFSLRHAFKNASFAIEFSILLSGFGVGRNKAACTAFITEGKPIT